MEDSIKKILTQFDYTFKDTVPTTVLTIYDNIPNNELDVLSGQMIKTKYSGLIIPAGSIALRPSSKIFTDRGVLRFNTDTKKLEYAHNTIIKSKAWNSFGESCSISGNWMACGAPYKNSNDGGVYMFYNSGGTWVETQILDSPIEYGGYFGKSCSISGNWMVIGAPYEDTKGTNAGVAYMFYNNNGIWLQTQILYASDAQANDNFGYSCSISGNWAIVGAYYEDTKGSDAGAAYVFYNNGGTWVQTNKLVASDGEANHNFGLSCSISGNWIVVGAPYEDTKGSGAGAAYVFYNSGGTWVETQILYASDGEGFDYFGYSCSVSGNWMVVGAYQEDTKESNAGAAYVFYNSGGTWVETQILYASDGEEFDYFGISCSIDKDWMVVGASNKDTINTDNGVAYIFYNSGGTWVETNKLKILDSDSEIYDYFGWSCGISGNWIVVGAPYKDILESDEGVAYMFYNNGSTWGETNKLMASDEVEWKTLI